MVVTKKELKKSDETLPDTQASDTRKKSIQQIISKLQSQGVNAQLCKRSKFVLGS
ncbi:hypothetical protein ACLM5H_10585 [Fredinandcohnia humi]